MTSKIEIHNKSMPQSRQLAAIMFTDIVGYTAMMQEDEASAMQLRHKLQKSWKKK